MSASRALPDLSALRLFAAPTGGGADASDSDDDDEEARKRQRVDPASYILAKRTYTFTFGKQLSESGVGIPDCKLTFRVYRCKQPWYAAEAMIPIAGIDYRGYRNKAEAQETDWICIVLYERPTKYGPSSTWAIAVELNGHVEGRKFLPAFSAKWRRGEICEGHKHIVAKYLVATDMILRDVLHGEPAAALKDLLEGIRDDFKTNRNHTKMVLLEDDTAISDDMESSFLRNEYAALMKKVEENEGKNLPEVVAGEKPITANDIPAYVAAAAVRVAIKLLWRAPYYKRLGAREGDDDAALTLKRSAEEYGKNLPKEPLVQIWMLKLQEQAKEHPNEWVAKQSDVDFLPDLHPPDDGWPEPYSPHFSLVLLNPRDAEHTVTDQLVSAGLVTYPNSGSVQSF